VRLYVAVAVLLPSPSLGLGVVCVYCWPSAEVSYQYIESALFIAKYAWTQNIYVQFYLIV